MGTGWRKAFCTTIPKERELKFVDHDLLQQDHHQQQLHNEDSSSPGLRCTTPSNQHDIGDLFSPNLHCKTTSPKSNSSNTPKCTQSWIPASPRFSFSIIKNTLRLSKNSCGVCMLGVKNKQALAIYTAECSHTFHFSCIVSHCRKQSTLFCPVCNCVWSNVPLLSHNLRPQQEQSIVPKLEQNQEKQIIKEPEPKFRNLEAKKGNIGLKLYNDDEPLLSPTAGDRKFTAIPEAVSELEEDWEEEEFQGFFVNPISSNEAFVNHKQSRNVEVTILPEAAVVSVGKTHETYAVVLKVKAPPSPPADSGSGSGQLSGAARRAPIDLVAVLDVSGSMGGAKLQMLKRAMRLVISSLGSADRLSIVAFSAAPKRLLPLRRMTAQGQKSARRIVDRLTCSQGTCVDEALRVAGKVLEHRRVRNPVASIILLSDGQDEKVKTRVDRNGRRETTQDPSTRFAHFEIPVNPTEAGFSKNAGFSRVEPNEDAFSKCVSGLLSVVAQEVTIQLGFSDHSDPAEVAAVYSYNSRPAAFNPVSVRLGDLYAEEERELLVEVRVPSTSIRAHHVLSLRCCYKDPAMQQDSVNVREESLLLPTPQAVRSASATIQRLRNLFITTRAIAESRRLTEHGELTSAKHILLSARSLLNLSGSSYVAEYVRGLEAELTKMESRKEHHQPLMKVIQRQRPFERETPVLIGENGEPLTPTSAWRAAERLANVAMMKKPVTRVSDLHGFESAWF
ncbi:unnamed protein product [Cuscuta epithymum]|uniref:Uncharacterized protein n=1 Tax=Cuscuta epithymum TaxID=186058 RepID=A0AAV0EAV1_9ASTE|nr:unnamed protein product [Cuscuta epithymum]